MSQRPTKGCFSLQAKGSANDIIDIGGGDFEVSRKGKQEMRGDVGEAALSAGNHTSIWVPISGRKKVERCVQPFARCASFPKDASRENTAKHETG